MIPGAVSVAIGATFSAAYREERADARREVRTAPLDRRTLLRVAAIVAVTTGIGGLVFQSATFALPRVLDERLAGSATAIGGYASLIFAAGVVAQLVVGVLVDRLPVRTVFAWVAGLQAVLFAAMMGLAGPLALLVAAGFMGAVFGQAPLNDVLVGRIARGEWRSRVYALRYMITFSVMATTLPIIAGVHAGRGFGALFGLLAVAATLILAAALLLPRAEISAGC